MTGLHEHSTVSVEVVSRLSADRLAEICDAAAVGAGGRAQSVRLELVSPERLSYSIRTHSVTGTDVEVMTFQVVRCSNGQGQTLSSQITSFKTRQRTFTPKESASWRTYKDFMHQVAASVDAEDPTARTMVVERGA